MKPIWEKKRPKSLGKREGFCEIWEFKCMDSNLCAAYEFGKEEEEESEGED